MSDCVVIINDPVLRELLGADKFDSFTELLNAAETRLLNQPFAFNNRQYYISAETNPALETIYTLVDDEGVSIEFSNFQNAIGFVFGNLGLINNYYTSSIENLNNGIDVLETLTSNPESSSTEIENLIQLIKDLIEDIKKISAEQAQELKSRFDQIVNAYSNKQNIPPDSIQTDELEHLNIEYIYPPMWIYDSKEEGYVYTNSLLDVARAKLALAIEDYETLTGDKIYFTLRKDTQENTQTGVFPDSKLGVVGELYVKVNGKFERVYVKDGTIDLDVNSKMELTTNIGEAASLGVNNSKLFTIVTPKFSNPSWKDQKLNPKVLELDKLRENVMKGVPSKFYPFQLAYHTHPKYYYTQESNKTKRSQSLKKFLRGRSYNNVELKVITKTNLNKYSKYNLKEGDVIAKIDNVPIKVFNNLKNTTLFDEIQGLLNHTYSDNSDLEKAVDYLNKLFYYEGTQRTSILKFEMGDNKIIMTSKVQTTKVGNKIKVSKNSNNQYEIVNPDQVEAQLTIAKFNISKNLVSESSQINKYYIENNQLKTKSVTSKDLYLDNLNVSAEQIKVGSKYKMVAQVHAVFDMLAGEDLIANPVQEALQNADTALPIVPKSVQEYLQNSNLSKANDEILRILLQVANGASGKLAARIASTQIIVDPSKNTMYNLDDNLIVIGKDVDITKPDELDSAIIHELIHLVVTPWLLDNENSAIAKRLQEIGEILVEEDITLDDQYLIHEILARLADPNYRAAIKNHESLLDEVIDLLRQIFEKIFNKKQNQIDANTYNRLVGEMLAVVKAEANNNATPLPVKKSKGRFQLAGLKKNKKVDTNFQLIKEFEKDRKADLIKFENTIKSLDSIAAFTIYRNENVFKFLKGQLSFQTLYNNIIEYIEEVQDISIDELTQFQNEPETLKIVNARLNFLNEILENKLKYEYYLKKYSTFIKSSGKIKIGETLAEEKTTEEKETVKPADSYTTNELAEAENKDVKVEKANEEDEAPEQDAQNQLENEITQIGNDRTFDRSGVESSSLKSAEREVLAFIAMNTYQFKEDPFGDKLVVEDNQNALLNSLIPIQNGEFAYESVLDENGIPKSPDLYILWNTLQRIVANANSFDEMLERMTYENGELYGHPEIGFLGDRIRRMINTATSENIKDVVRFTTRIWRALNRYSTPMMTVLKSTQESEENPNEDPSVKLTVKVHGSDIRTPAINYITNRILETYDKAEELGIIVNNSIKAKRVAELLKSNDYKIRNQTISRLGLRVPEVVEKLSSYEEFIEELTVMFEQTNQTDIPLNYIEHFVFGDRYNRVKNFTRAWNVFINDWNLKRPFFRSQMRLNSENELQSDYSIGAAIFKDISYLTSSTTGEELFNNIPRLNTHYGKSSLVMLRNAWHRVKIFNYNGYQYKQGNKIIGRKSIKLDSPEYLAQSLASFFKEGVMENIRAQVATTSLALKVQWGDSRNDIYPFSLELVSEMFDNITNPNKKGPKIPKPILEQILKYLRADLLTHQEPVLTSNIFSNIADPQATLEIIDSYISSGSYERNPDLYTEDIVNLEQQVIDFIRTEVRFATQLFKDNFVENIISEDPYFSDLAAKHGSFFRDPYQFLYGAFAFYSHIMKVEEVILFHGDIKQIGKFYKRSNSQQSTGTMLDISENTLDAVRDDLEYESFGSLIGKPLQIDKNFESGSIPDDVRNITEVITSRADIRASLRMYNKSKGFEMSIEEENAFMDLYEVYRASNISDGAAYIHPDAYKVFMMMAGLDTKDFDHIHRANYLEMKKEMNNDLTASEQEELDILTEHIFSGKIQLPTLKFSYRGPATQGGAYLEMFDKFALAPLFPNMFPQGHPGRKMFTFMSSNNLAYVKFESGTKFKNVNKVTGSINEFLKILENPNYEVEVNNKHVLRTEYLKEQIKTPSKPKMDNTLGVQFRELIISSITDKSLIDVWTDLLTKYIGSKQLQVLNSFGFELNQDNKLQINSEALKRNLGRLLIEGVQSRELPVAVLDFVEKYSNIKNPSEAHAFFEASMNSGMLENIISSMINKMVSVKVPGAMFIQLPPTIFGDDLKFYRSEEGAYPGGFQVLRAQTKITMPKHMFGLLNIPEIKSQENLKTQQQKFKALNELMKQEDFRKKYAKQLTIVTYRIPTQEYNSMEVFEIVEFLPPWFGPHVVLPPGITTKSGTDFDYDKMSSLLPMLDADGNIKEESLVNTMITSIASQLLKQENFFRLLKPTSPDDVMNEVKFILGTLGIKYGDATLGNIFNMSTWFSKWKAVKMKDMLGIAATWNRLYSTLLNNKFEISSNYTTNHFVNKTSYIAPYVSSFSFFNAVEGKGVNDERIGSNLNESFVAGKNFYKWDLLCQFINVTVDASTDDTFGYTNIDKNMFATAMYMMFIKNIPLDITLQFLHHPVIQRFEKLKKEYQIVDKLSRNLAAKEAYSEISRMSFYNYGGLLKSIQQNIKSINLQNIKFGNTPEEHAEKFKSTRRYDPLSDTNILSHYLFLLEEVGHMFKVQAAIDIDKNYDSRMSLAQSRIVKLNSAKISGFSKPGFIDRVLTKSTRSPFHIAPFTSQIYSILYPINYSKINQDLFGFALNGKSSLIKMDDESYYRALTYDFMLSVLHNFGVTHNNESLLDRGKKYISTPIKFLQKVQYIQSLIPESKLRILSNTFNLIGFQVNDSYTYATKFFTGFDNATQDKNILHDELVFMLNHPNAEVKEFAYDIIYMGMVQSGWRKSQYYFNDILPESVTTPIVYNAMKLFSSLSEADQYSYVTNYMSKINNYLTPNAARAATLFRSYKSFIDITKVDPDFKFSPLAAELNFNIQSAPTTEYTEYEEVTPESVANALPSGEVVVDEYGDDYQNEYHDSTSEIKGLTYYLNETQDLHPKDRFIHNGDLKRTLDKLKVIQQRNFNNAHYRKTIDFLIDVTQKLITLTSTPQLESTPAPVQLSTKENPLAIYSDGSDIKGTGKIGYGAVYIHEGKEFGLSGTEESSEVKNLQALFPDAKFSNPTMEMLALTTVLETFQNTSEHISIFQDYKGAVNYGELWNYSEGSNQRESKPWKAKEKYIAHLVDRAVAAIKKIEANGGSVKLNWVKGHAGNKMNDLADKYAKQRDLLNNLLGPIGQPQQAAPVTTPAQLPTKQVQTINDPAEFTNHSGGALGVDSDGDAIGREFNVTKHIHYYTGVRSEKNAPNGNQEVTSADKIEGARKVAQAANKMWGNQIDGEIVPYSYATMKDDKLIRNWSQVKYSEGIYAIAPIGLKGDPWIEDVKTRKPNPRILLKDGVQGGTGYAVEMGIQNGNKVYVFNTQPNDKYEVGWYQIINSQYVKLTQTPTLTKNFALVGSRANPEIGKQAIRDLYQQTFSPSPLQLAPSETVTAPKTPAANMDEAAPQLFDPTNKVIQPGSLVIYKGERYLVYKIDDKDSTRINLVSPLGQILKSIPEEDLIVQGKYKVVSHTNRINYIVTDKENIYSTATGKLAYTSNDNSTVNQKNMILREAYKDVIIPAKPKDKTPTATVGRHPILDERKNMIAYTPLQAKALTEIAQLMEQSGTKFYVLAGYAGTGKTTLIENIHNYAKKLNRKPLIMAPVNKAASNVTKKLNSVGIPTKATTIHSSIYGAPNVDKETNELVFGLKATSFANNVIVIDEVSMLTGDVLNDILSHLDPNSNNTIIFMGDSFQLKAVGQSANILKFYENYDSFKQKFGITIDGYTELTEVMRQELESNILKAATLTRINKYPVLFDNQDNPEVIDFKITSSADALLKAFIRSVVNNEDSIYITVTNNHRIAVNKQTREAIHGSNIEVLLPNEPVLAVNNSLYNSNGDIFKVREINSPFQPFTVQLTKGKDLKSYDVYLVMVNDGVNGSVPLILIPNLDLPSVSAATLFSSNTDLRSTVEKMSLTKPKDKLKINDLAIVGTYGYAITGHKSQGSQWDTVFINQDFIKSDNPADNIQWYYTILTRALKNVRVLYNEKFHNRYYENELNSELENKLQAEQEESKIDECNPNQTKF